jgi:5-keto-L-gluconate epimerase
VQLSITAALEAGKTAPVLLRGPFESSFRFACRRGFDGVELHVRNPMEIDWQKVRGLCKECRLRVPTIGTGTAASIEGMTFTSPDPNVREKAVERIQRHIDLAEHLEAGVTIGLIYGSVSGSTATVSEGKKTSEDCLDQCCRYAEAHGVLLFFEAINRYEINQINTIAEVAGLIEKIGSKNLKLLADTFHMNIEEVDMAQSLRHAAGYLGHVHLADSNRQAPGRGHTPLAGLVRILEEKKFTGHISFEALPLPDGETAAMESIGYMKSLSR